MSDIIGTIVNKSIDLLPVGLQLAGYQFCGPGTKLKKRLKRGDPGINKLDAACKQHGVIYSKYSDSENRSSAYKVLADKACEQVKSNDASHSEKAAAWSITSII